MFRLNIGRTARNASWIIGCKVAQSFVNLVITMISARYLGPSNYGLLSYASSIVAFVIPIMQLGFSKTLVQELIEEPEQEGRILGTALILNLVSAVACIVGVFTFLLFVNAGETDTIIVGLLLAISLLFQATEISQYWFQAKLLSKYYAIASLIAYCIVAVYKVYLLVTGKSVVWFAISNSLDYLLISVILVAVYFKLGRQKLEFSFDLGRRMFQRSKYYILSGMMVTIFSQTDRIMLKIMVDETETGYYSAAFTCVSTTAFVFVAIVDSMRASILTEKKKQSLRYEERLVQLYSVITYLALAQSLAMSVFAEQIVKILYGKQYLDCVVALRIVVWYVAFSYYGSVRNIWMLAEGKQKYLWIINLSGAVMNIAINLLLIPKYGAAGAAIATLVTQVFANIVIGFVLKPIKYNNLLLWKGLSPKPFYACLKQTIRKI